MRGLRWPESTIVSEIECTDITPGDQHTHLSTASSRDPHRNTAQMTESITRAHPESLSRVMCLRIVVFVGWNAQVHPGRTRN